MAEARWLIVYHCDLETKEIFFLCRKVLHSYVVILLAVANTKPTTRKMLALNADETFLSS